MELTKSDKRQLQDIILRGILRSLKASKELRMAAFRDAR